jgi:hypothetical protein
VTATLDLAEAIAKAEHATRQQLCSCKNAYYAVQAAAPLIERQVRERIADQIRDIAIRDFNATDPNSTFPSGYEVRNRAEAIALTGRDPVAP